MHAVSSAVMSTPRRSARLQGKEEGRVRRESRLKAKRSHQLSSPGGRSLVRNGGSQSSDSEGDLTSDSEDEVPMATPTRTSGKKLINDFTKVSVCRFCRKPHPLN